MSRDYRRLTRRRALSVLPKGLRNPSSGGLSHAVCVAHYSVNSRLSVLFFNTVAIRMYHIPSISSCLRLRVATFKNGRVKMMSAAYDATPAFS